ncbi:hypothetical protein PD716_08600 [Vibrio gigantis]|uniref:hypothetical protein n=1 Tax=Vibrio TaxID=662 RepID=UPI000C84804B|nr:hypothetical protein [Vibrio lentus]PME66092.1 hypothetical protein BCV33_01960 [Vibrio lentus]PMG61460.1 hypothetical protein BCU87_14225 [Vibrio lentus]PMN01896.1 hypothetical protein BCT40_22990 [Vibrio lentus]TKF58566.1 hypothetical protein FCV63_07615 [Vibrio lentus]
MTFSDVEKLGKMSSLLTIPLIAACMYVKFGLWFADSDSWYLFIVELGLPWLTQIIYLISFFLSVVVVSLAYVGVNSLLSMNGPLLFFIGLTLISYGLLGIFSFVGGDHLAELFATNNLIDKNYILHVAALSWGFDIFYTQEKASSS